MNTDFIIPDSTSLEISILGSIIDEPTLIPDVMRIIKREMFQAEENAKIWDIIMEMYTSHQEISPLTIMPKVERKYFVDNFITLRSKYSTLRGLLSLVDAFVDTYIKRRAYVASTEILGKISNGASSGEIKGLFNNFSSSLNDEMRDDSFKTSTDTANKLAEGLMNGTRIKVPSSIPTLDYLTYGGFSGGALCILAARPSVGKTTIALQMALEASRKNLDALVVSLEMSSEELIQRLILSTGLVSPFELYSGNINWSNFEQAVANVTNPYLRINDKSKTIDEIVTKISLECQRGKCKIAFIDYLGLISITNPRMTLAQQLGEFTRKLKLCAKENNIPIVLLCQLNRESAKDGRPPQLYDLRDSGSIEQDADIVMMLDSAKDNGGDIIKNAIDLWVRKNRGGSKSDSPIRLQGNETYSNFIEIHDEQY